APQPPPAAVPARSLPQRVARLEEEVYGLRGALGDVGIKRILSAVEVNAASYDCYYCWFKLQLLVGVTTAAQN
ncbi:hypothetical protein Tco_0912364, partial [Tanacetum coccineum]